jgi:hypothetical protein
MALSLFIDLTGAALNLPDTVAEFTNKQPVLSILPNKPEVASWRTTY